MRTLLIPSAVLVSRDMRRKFGDLPTALFPLGNKTMIERIYDKYKNSVDKVYIVVKKNRLLVKDYVKFKKLPVEIIELDELNDLGYTIRYGLEHIVSKNNNVDYVYVNFADSLLDDKLPVSDADFVYYANDINVDEWTYFVEQNGKIKHIIDKNIDETEDEIDKLDNIFVGVFGFSKPQELLQKLKSTNETTRRMDSFYQAIYDYSHQYPFTMLETENWFDVGHSENYNKATTNVTARSFNSIEIDEERGVLKKRSENKEKLVNEIRWYLRLPNKLQYLLPRIYDYSLELNNPYVNMEYYGYHTLHELLMYGNIPLVKWQHIFNKILFAVKDMGRFKVDGSAKEFEVAMRDIYLQKTLSRLNKIRNDEKFAKFFIAPIVVNGKEYRSLDEYIALLPNLIEKLLISSFSGKFNIIHGDLCFTNILIEDTYDFLRVIDPRGQFGSYDIYGDARYELAKLMHTLEGKYDLIIEDMFDIDIKDTNIEYQTHKNIDNILRVFMDVFRDAIQDINAVRLVEATLFLSMIPLHSDYVQRQYAMLATGVMLLERVINEEGMK